MNGTTVEDIRSLTVLREGYARAESTGAATFFESALTDDAVIMPPWRPACEGKSACLQFVREVLTDLSLEFEREVTLTSVELHVNGDWAFDRGTFSQSLVRKVDGVELRELGKYFWLFRREAGTWKLARVVGNYDWRSDQAESDAG